MFVAMVDKAIDETKNPRTSEFFDLEFFEDVEHLCNYISIETKNGYYVRDIWSTYLQSKLPVNVIYHVVGVKVLHVKIQHKEKLLFTIKPDPKNKHRRWVVQRSKQNN